MDSESRERMKSNPVFRVLRWTVPWIVLAVLGWVLLNMWSSYQVAKLQAASAEPTPTVPASVGSTLSAEAVTLIAQLKLRETPGTDGKILVELNKGAKLTVSEIRDGWYHVTYVPSKGKPAIGWVTANSQYVKIVKK
jgi:uncharacterized protein YgiM (DUF1202 family)